MAAKTGRPVEVDPDAVAAIALRLFAERGLDSVTMDEIAAAAGVGRRTLFRLFRGKDDLVWGGSTEAGDRIAEELARVPDEVDPRTAIRRAYVAALRFPDDLLPVTRARLRLIGDHPRLTAVGVARLATNRDVLASYLVRRAGLDAPDLAVEALTSAVTGAGLAAMLWWARHEDGAPGPVVDRALRLVLEPDRAAGGAAGAE